MPVDLRSLPGKAGFARFAVAAIVVTTAEEYAF
jgi:hypothetical protein